MPTGCDDVVAALAPAFGDIAVLPVHPRPDKPAIRVLVRAVKGASFGAVDQPRLDLNDMAGPAERGRGSGSARR